MSREESYSNGQVWGMWAVIIVMLVIFGIGMSIENSFENPYSGCTIESMSKTGKKAGGNRSPVQYETVRVYDCPEGKRFEVFWENW